MERVRCSYLGMSVLWAAMNRTAPLQSTMKVALAGMPASLGKVEGRAWHLATPRPMESTRSWSERRGNPRAPPKPLLIHLLMARGLSAVTPTTWPRERRGSHLATLHGEGLHHGLQGSDLLGIHGQIHREEEDDKVVAAQLLLEVEHLDRLAVPVYPGHLAEGEEVVGPDHRVGHRHQLQARVERSLIEVCHHRSECWT